jgi:hypothetical protein
LVCYKADLIIIWCNLTCSRHDIAEELLIWTEATLTHSLTHSLIIAEPIHQRNTTWQGQFVNLLLQNFLETTEYRL